MTNEEMVYPATGKQWLVLGSTGFVGSGIKARALERGIHVRSISAPHISISENSNLKEILEFIENSSCLKTLVDEFSDADVVINAAGLASPDAESSEALTGANAVLPGLIFRAATLADVRRVVHISSAAVQGNREILDESNSTKVFSPYSKSKALGESVASSLARSSTSTNLAIIRATSVQGENRKTTQTLKKIAKSPFASVASPGSQPSAVSSIDGLSEFVVHMAATIALKSPIVLIQPWEGASVRDVLQLAGGKEPVILPKWFCRLVIGSGNILARLSPRVAGLVRRVEVMWFGQKQVAGYAIENGLYQYQYQHQQHSANVSDHLIQALTGKNK